VLIKVDNPTKITIIIVNISIPSPSMSLVPSRYSYIDCTGHLIALLWFLKTE
jgi:hypothetical protein